MYTIMKVNHHEFIRSKGNSIICGEVYSQIQARHDKGLVIPFYVYINVALKFCNDGFRNIRQIPLFCQPAVPKQKYWCFLNLRISSQFYFPI